MNTVKRKPPAKTTSSLTIQPIAPSYEFKLVTISDQFNVQSKWLLPAGPLETADMQILNLMHIHHSQAETRRN